MSDNRKTLKNKEIPTEDHHQSRFGFCVADYRTNRSENSISLIGYCALWSGNSKSHDPI